MFFCLNDNAEALTRYVRDICLREDAKAVTIKISQSSCEALIKEVGVDWQPNVELTNNMLSGVEGVLGTKNTFLPTIFRAVVIEISSSLSLKLPIKGKCLDALATFVMYSSVESSVQWRVVSPPHDTDWPRGHAEFEKAYSEIYCKAVNCNWKPAISWAPVAFSPLVSKLPEVPTRLTSFLDYFQNLTPTSQNCDGIIRLLSGIQTEAIDIHRID